MCDSEATYYTCPQPLRHLWKHQCYSTDLVSTFEEAVMLNMIHRSKEDVWWTESYLRLRDFARTTAG